MRRPSPIPASLGPVFDVTTAQRAGVGEYRLRNDDLHRPYRGVRAVRTERHTPRRCEEQIVSRAREYAPRLAEDFFYCSITALALWGVDLPSRLAREPLHINGPLNRARAVLDGVMPHRYADVEVGEVDGMPVVAPVSAWVQSASRLSVDELIEVGDALVRRKNPLTTIEALGLAAEKVGRRPGAARLRAAMPWIRPRTDSPPETRTRLLIVRAGFPEPEVNVEVRDDEGGFLGVGDLVYRRWKIVIEHEGEYHFASAEQGRRDIDRFAAYVRAGWTPLRPHRDTLTAPASFLGDLDRSIRAAELRLHP